MHVLPCPDPYRGTHLDGRAAARGAIAEAKAAGGEICAFISESILSCGGQVGTAGNGVAGRGFVSCGWGPYAVGLSMVGVVGGVLVCVGRGALWVVLSIAEAKAAGWESCALISESILPCGGQAGLSGAGALRCK